MPGKRSRDKGARGELEIAGLLTDMLGVPVARRLLQAREGGDDLDGLPVSVEVKRYKERARLPEWLAQARESAQGRPYAVIHRPDGGQWRAVIEMDLEEFAAWVREQL